jgi:glutamine---fructose-6-phosphate transaminase (isomerizing)
MSSSWLIQRGLRGLSKPPLRSLAGRQAVTKTPVFSSLSSLAGSSASSEQIQSASSRIFPWLAGGVILTAAAASSYNNNTDCCGIVGVVGTSEHRDAREFLLDGLTILMNRGYDSAGIATIPHHGDEMKITKFASDGEKADCINLVKQHSQSHGHTLGIAHTRWATHGGKTDENAHPHTDSSGKIALVHNGTLTNTNELRRQLQAEGHIFSSQTDTEVIVKLIGKFYAEGNISLKNATEKALKLCDGTWGLGIICTDSPDELVVACNGSPLVIGIADDRTFIASETSAFNRYTKNFISMKDGEIGVLHADGRTLDLSRAQTAPDQRVKLSPDPYPHWTLKELTEQPEAIARALGFGGRMSHEKVLLGGLDNHEKKMTAIKHMTLSACGTSLNAARYGERLMKHLGSFDSVASIDAAETETKDFPCMNEPSSTGLIVVSQSGETKDVQRVVTGAMDKGVTVLSVVNAVGSLIARTTKLGVYCNAGRENAVASTKAFTTQVTVLALIALWFKEHRDRLQGKGPSMEAIRLKESLMRLPIAFGMALKSRDQCKEIAKRLLHKEHCFVLGKGRYSRTRKYMTL